MRKFYTAPEFESVIFESEKICFSTGEDTFDDEDDDDATSGM